jgi:hypothetical protein
MNQDLIENHILYIAKGLECDIPEDEIIKAYSDIIPFDELFLILSAAKLIVKSRKEAPPKKTLIRRL